MFTETVCKGGYGPISKQQTSWVLPQTPASCLEMWGSVSTRNGYLLVRSSPGQTKAVPMPAWEQYVQDPSPSGLLEAVGGKNSGCGAHPLPSFQEVQGQDHLAPA